MDRQMLGEAFARLRKGAAARIDGVTYEQYAEDLERNLADLTRRLKCGQYRAQIWNDYAIRGNSAMTAKYDREVKFLLFKWLNRRSQRRSFTWNQFLSLLPSWKLPPPRIAIPSPQLPLPWPNTPA